MAYLCNRLRHSLGCSLPATLPLTHELQQLIGLLAASGVLIIQLQVFLSALQSGRTVCLCLCDSTHKGERLEVCIACGTA